MQYFKNKNNGKKIHDEQNIEMLNKDSTQQSWVKVKWGQVMQLHCWILSLLDILVFCWLYRLTLLKVGQDYIGTWIQRSEYHWRSPWSLVITITKIMLWFYEAKKGIGACLSGRLVVEITVKPSFSLVGSQ